MSLVAQYAIVALLVIMAALFATWRLISSTARLRLLDAMLRGLPAAQSGSTSALRTAVLRKRAKVATAGGCSACASTPKPPASRRN